ncbi:hypothetical protein Dimus_027472 [Dionaea muscipula]
MNYITRKCVEAADHLLHPHFFALYSPPTIKPMTFQPHIPQPQKMAEAMLFNVAEALLKKLGSKALEEIAAAWGFKDQLEKLKETATMINGMLADAEQRQVQDKAVQLWLERLRSVVYDADDLFDEFSTIVMRKELMTGSSLSKEVRLFFSTSNQPAFAYKMARQVKKIRERLDGIAKDGNEFAFRQIHGNDIVQALSLGRRETISFVAADQVIGREEDKKAIVEMLMLDPTVRENISVLSIVGTGGLGKTTLAQLVFNDDKITNHFELKLWVCVGDVFDMKEVIKNILMSATDKKPDDVGIEQLQRQLRREIDGKKFLLVFDDVWNFGDRNKWLELKALLMAGSIKSKILVTTRSWDIAEIVGRTNAYDLKALSKEKSRSLFESLAFEPGQQQLYPNLVEIGKEIVKKCVNVPLAIRTLGGLLYGKTQESMWLSLKDNELPKIPEGGDNIMAILKISYHHLPSPLKNCFAYCSLFPKDYEMDKETLISLWMAEGFIIRSSESQSLEDAGDMYFLTLLQRCFFQDITRDEWGDIKYCKMHDLMHDLAQEVAGTETIVAKLGMTTFDNKRARHLSFDYSLSSEVPTSLFELKSLRTFLLPKHVFMDDGQLSQIFSSFSCLRVLDLCRLNIESLPSSIGDLVHLRYLDLSLTEIKGLPASITKLQNLQTLKLHQCFLEILPMDIRKLINLRHLSVSDCNSLTCMPAGIGTLTNLHKLDYFVVGSKGSAANSRTMDARLRDLNGLAKLRGSLCIKIVGELRDPANEAKEASLRNKSGLTELHIEGNSEDCNKDDAQKHDEAVLDGLQPHPNLKMLKIERYRGQRLPNWASMDSLNSSLPNLVEVSLRDWKWCQNVPWFQGLRFLKRLTLEGLGSVEYMESSNYKLASSTLFFPSLEELTLRRMHKLNGWWNMEVEAETSTREETAILSSTTSIGWWQQHHKQLPSFPTLHRLTIKYCRNLKSMPVCPNLEQLELFGVNKELVVQTWMVSPIEYSTAASSSSFQSASSSRLKTLSFDDVDNILSLSAGCLQSLSSLTIQDRRLADLSALGKVFRSFSSLKSLEISGCDGLRSLSGGLEHLSFLQSLGIRYCDGLRSLSGGLEHLSSLEKMEFSHCKELDLSAECMEVDMPWKALKGLRSFELRRIPKMVELPNGLQHLTTLRSLQILDNKELIALPE